MDWEHLLAYITGTVDQELLVRNEYLVTENRILRNHIKESIKKLGVGPPRTPPPAADPDTSVGTPSRAPDSGSSPASVTGDARRAWSIGWVRAERSARACFSTLPVESEVGRRRDACRGPAPSAPSRTGLASFPAPCSPVITSGRAR
jgi:hypothetical protein